MRLNALYLIGTLTISAIPPLAGTAAAQPAGILPAQSDRQAAVSVPRGTQAPDACPPGYYWEPSSYARHGKFRFAHCAPRLVNSGYPRDRRRLGDCDGSRRH